MYLLVTPAKDEENNIPKLVESVLKQSIRPTLWVIIDDNSGDRTSLLIQDICNEFDWIKLIEMNEKSEYDWLRYGSVVSYGFEYAINHLKSNDMYYEFLGILDADIVLNNNYFELLIEKLNCEPDIGVVSGTLYIKKNGDIIPENKSDQPRGGARLYRRHCFETIGGFSKLPSPDTITDIKASNRGWKLARETKSKGLHNRLSSSGRGIWNGYKKQGEGRYYLNYHPFNVFLTGMYHCTKYPFYHGIAYIYGYIIKYLISAEKTDDIEIQDYFWQSWARLKQRVFDMTWW